MKPNDGPSPDDADALAEAFEQAGERIGAALHKASQRGQLSFSDMAESMLKDLARLAVNEVFGSLLGALSGAGGSSRSGAGVNINMTVNGASDPDGFRRSEGQIAAQLSRAVSAGQGRR